MKKLTAILLCISMAILSGCDMSIAPAQETVASTFPDDLQYMGIYSTPSGMKLSMRNRTALSMSVSINYVISCYEDDGPVETSSHTVTFEFDPFEQKESRNTIDNWSHYWDSTVFCSGLILSIVPTYRDSSNFQPWTGNYNIHSNIP